MTKTIRTVMSEHTLPRNIQFRQGGINQTFQAPTRSNDTNIIFSKCGHNPVFAKQIICNTSSKDLINALYEQVKNNKNFKQEEKTELTKLLKERKKEFN